MRLNGLVRTSLPALAVLAFLPGRLAAQFSEPVLFFSDLTSGPASGNSDASGGRVGGRDGAIVTLWGRGLGTSAAAVTVTCNGASAASIYSLTDAVAPADLVTYHRMQMLSFQVSQLAQSGPGQITVTVNGHTSNSLPFAVRPGGIFFVKATGSDDSGVGSWSNPWRTIVKAKGAIAPGDIVYVGDGVDQTAESENASAVDLFPSGTSDRPKALVVYPGGRSHVGNETIERAFHTFDGSTGGYATDWVVAKFDITTGQTGVLGQAGFRIVGNRITAPRGDGLDGAIGVLGGNVAVLGNELTNVGGVQAGKYYHAIYVSGVRSDVAPRGPTERNREVAWNYIHDGNSNRAINVYSEQTFSAFLSEHRIHDNVIVNQHGDGILLGYHVTGENWIYDNLIVRAGLGPEWPDDSSTHAGIRIDAGHESVTGTLVHCDNNTLYGCGYAGAASSGENGHLYVSAAALSRSTTVQFRNNVVFSTGEPYLAGESAPLPANAYRNCWYGAGTPPSWDTGAIAADPRFVEPSHGSFELQAGSPCVDAGLDLSSTLTRDLYGVPRPQGAAFDLGPFERFAGSGGSCALSCSASAPSAGTAGQLLAFSASATPSGCPPGVPSFTWLFGDGSTSTAASPTHTYAASGTYPWSMKAALGGVECSRSGSITISAPTASGPELLLPVVLDVFGEGGSHYTTELTLVSRAVSAVTVTLLYTAASGGGSGTAALPLAPGEIRVIPDAIQFLRLQGLQIPEDTGAKVGTLRATFGGADSASDVFLGGRTSTPGGGGTFGLFYPALALEQTATTTVWIYGLHQTPAMRSNLAVVNRGDAGDPVTLRIRFYGNLGVPLGTPVDVTLGPGEWRQLSRPLEPFGVPFGYASVERVSGGSHFLAYGVLNDAITSDGSYVGMSR